MPIPIEDTRSVREPSCTDDVAAASLHVWLRVLNENRSECISEVDL